MIDYECSRVLTNAATTGGTMAIEDTTEVERQQKLLHFLLKPGSYPHHPRKIRLVQTHSSWIFMAPPFVYKVKKPVNLGFLDFSTLEKRRHFCEREVVLNRRLAPNMYLGVIPISVKSSQITFLKGKQIVEYAVKMRKLSEQHFLDKLVERDAVTRKDLRRLIVALKKFYETPHPTQEIEVWGRIDHLKIS